VAFAVSFGNGTASMALREATERLRVLAVRDLPD
jgi:hypothetical protein